MWAASAQKDTSCEEISAAAQDKLDILNDILLFFPSSLWMFTTSQEQSRCIFLSVSLFERAACESFHNFLLCNTLHKLFPLLLLVNYIARSSNPNPLLCLHHSLLLLFAFVNLLLYRCQERCAFEVATLKLFGFLFEAALRS